MQTTSTNTNPVISCIYINYQSAKLLERSLESLFSFENNSPFEIIVINNDASEKEEIGRLQEKFSFILIDACHNPGFAASANKAAEKARGKILFFINPDTLWKQSLFLQAEKYFQENKKLGALGISLVSPHGKRDEKGSGKLFFFPKYLQRKSETSIEWVSGGALFVRAETFRSLQGFDERFFLYFEDMDLCARISNNHQEVLLVRDMEIVHLSGKSHKTRKTQKKLYDQSLYKYAKKHLPNVNYRVFRFIHPIYRFFFPYGRS